MRVKLSREGALILLIGAIDLVTTVWFVRSHGAAEGNPLMRIFLARGVFVFIVAKAAFCLGPVTFLEWARRSHPVLVRRALRITIVVYLGAYLAGGFGLNQESVAKHYMELEPEVAMAPPPPLVGPTMTPAMAEEIERHLARGRRGK